MSNKIRAFDPAEHLTSPEAVQAFLEDAFDEGDPAYITHALGIVARARGMSRLADETGMTRPALYKALSSEGNPSLATTLKVARALGFRLTPVRVQPAA